MGWYRRREKELTLSPPAALPDLAGAPFPGGGGGGGGGPPMPGGGGGGGGGGGIFLFF